MVGSGLIMMHRHFMRVDGTCTLVKLVWRIFLTVAMVEVFLPAKAVHRHRNTMRLIVMPVGWVVFMIVHRVECVLVWRGMAHETRLVSSGTKMRKV